MCYEPISRNGSRSPGTGKGPDDRGANETPTGSPHDRAGLKGTSLLTITVQGPGGFGLAADGPGWNSRGRAATGRELIRRGTQMKNGRNGQDQAKGGRPRS